jgi:four helix bundle protein
MWNFRNLEAWKRAVDLSKVIYDITRKFPNEEKYGLSD